MTAEKLKTPCVKGRIQEGGKCKAQSAPVTVSVVTPTGEYRVDGKINQIPISFLLYMEAAVTLILKDVRMEQNQPKKRTEAGALV